MTYLVDRSGSAPELIVDLLNSLPTVFPDPNQIVELAKTAGDAINYVAFDRVKFEPVAVALVAGGEGPVSRVTLIAVRTAHQRKGVATALLNRIYEDLVADEVTELQVAAGDLTAATAEFWTAAGFTPSASGTLSKTV